MKGTWVRSLVWEDSTCHQATEQGYHNYWSLRSRPVLCNKRSHCSEKPTHCQEEEPLLTATIEKIQCSVNNNLIIFFFKIRGMINTKLRKKKTFLKDNKKRKAIKIGNRVRLTVHTFYGYIFLDIGYIITSEVFSGFPRWLSGKGSVYQCRRRRRSDSILGSGRSPGGGNGNPPQYSCQEIPTDRGAWWDIQSAESQRVRHDLVTEHAWGF